VFSVQRLLEFFQIILTQQIIPIKMLVAGPGYSRKVCKIPKHGQRPFHHLKLVKIFAFFLDFLVIVGNF